MDWTAIITELGGGLPAVVIAALAFWGWTERRDARAAYNKLADREREFSKELAETIRSVEAVSRAIQGGQI